MRRKKIYLVFPLLLGIVMVVILSLFMQSGRAAAQEAPGQNPVIKNALEYLKSQQQADGGITGFSGVSDPDTTARTVIAFSLAGEPVSGVISSGGYSMLDYLANQAITFTHDITGTLFPGRAGLLLTAVSLSTDNPANFGGMDMITELGNTLQPDTGAYSTTAKQDFSSGEASDVNQAWSILGLSLAGETVPEAARLYLSNSQAPDGSWGSADPDTTSLALTALVATQQVSLQDKVIQNAVDFFHITQLANGGWKPSWDTDPLNADSTGWILQALISAGQNPTDQTWTMGQVNPIQALESLQKADGSIGGTYANTYGTAEAVIGLSQVPLSRLGIAPVSHRAGLIVFYGDGSVYTSCVDFPESSLTGLELLQRSGVSIETATNPNQGTAVCKIGNVGSPSDDCFGGMPNYWSYWQLGGNEWQYSVTGADQSQVVDGDVNAWSWGTGNPPAVVNFQNLCEGVAFVLPTATVTVLPPTDTPEPTLTSAPIAATNTVPATAAPAKASGGVGTYIVFGSILIVLAILVIYLIYFRRKA